jgi:hypothetical protein
MVAVKSFGLAHPTCTEHLSLKMLWIFGTLYSIRFEALTLALVRRPSLLSIVRSITSSPITPQSRREFSSSCNARRGSPIAFTSLALSISACISRLWRACSIALYAVCQWPALRASLAEVTHERDTSPSSRRVGLQFILT